jgi:hypothetical protein
MPKTNHCRGAAAFAPAEAVWPGQQSGYIGICKGDQFVRRKV